MKLTPPVQSSKAIGTFISGGTDEKVNAELSTRGAIAGASDCW